MACYLANLQAAGCPSDVIQTILFAEADRQFLVRRAALPVHTNFWMTGPDRDLARHRAREHEKALHGDIRDSVQALLGVDWRWKDRARRDDDDLFQYVAAMGDFLEESKIVQVGELLKRYAHQREEDKPLFDIDAPEDLARRRTRYEQFHHELRAVLTSTELEELQLRFHGWNLVDVWSVAAQYGSELTGAELREVLRITRGDQDPFADFLGYQPRAPADPNLDQQKDAQLRSYLGEERFHAYQTAKDSEFRFLHRFIANELKLPSATAVALHHARRTTEADAARISGDISVTTAQRREALDALQPAAEARVRALLGEPGWASYRQQHGAWIENLGARQP